MTAIITDDFRRNQARLFVNDVKASNLTAFNSGSPTNSMQDTHRENSNYAIGIGKSDKWSATENTVGFSVAAPTGSIQEAEDVHNNLIALKEIATTGVNQMIAVNTWTNGRKYKVYDQTDPNTFYATGDLYPCYVINADKIYLCLSNHSQGAAETVRNSTSAPTHSNFGFNYSSGDGYVWAHVQTIPTTGDISKFTTPQFVPVSEPAGGDITNSETNTGGLLYDVGIVDGGSNYSNPSATLSVVDVNGDTVAVTGLALNVTQSGGVITRINLADDGNTDSSTYWGTADAILGGSGTGGSGTNLLHGTITITDTGSGTGAKAVPLIAPKRGFGGNPLDVLPTWFVACIADFENTESGELPTDISFRQVSLLKDFTRNGSETDVVYDALKKITVSGINGTKADLLEPGDILSAGNSKFYFDYRSGNDIYYHQNSNSEVNFIEPDTAGTVTVDVVTSGATSGEIAADVTAVADGEYPHRDATTNEFNGEVIFHENRKPFSRGASQTEEVKLIIQL